MTNGKILDILGYSPEQIADAELYNAERNAWVKRVRPERLEEFDEPYEREYREDDDRSRADDINTELRLLGL